MKIAIQSMVVVALMVLVGCQDKKPAADSTALELSSPSASAQNAPAPLAYAPPVQDPSQASSTPTMNAAAASGSTYTVKPGDTLWKIAATHYGEGKKWHQIADANPGLTPEKLRVGQTITLP